MKIRVYDSDGVYRGGLFKTDCFNPSSCRVWWARPMRDCKEFLIDISGHSEPSYASSWYIVCLSRNPEISGPPDGSDDFDADSKAIRITPLEAMDWFENQVYRPPADLIELAKAFDPEATPAYELDNASPEPLSEALQEVWDLLDGKAMTAKQIAVALTDSDYTREDAMRKRIHAIRQTGRTISSRKDIGYYRFDAPPPELADGQRESG